MTNDTGASSTDRITSDPSISGTVIDEYMVTDFRAGFDNIPTSNFKSVLADRQPNGSFTFNRTRLEEIYGSTLPEGTHTLHLKATDQFGNVGVVKDIPFTLDSTAPITLFDLNAATDTNPVGDRTTTNNIVTLTGQTQPDTAVKLLETNATALADVTGKFSFSGVSLNLGANTFTVQATDIAGNTSTVSRTITREQVPNNQAPKITSTPVTESFYYKPYTYKVTATDPENDPLTYSLVSPATGPMAGMNIDTQGLLSWTPANTGNYNVTVRVSDNQGNQTDQTYTLKVPSYVDDRPPVFTSLPLVSATYKEQYTYQAIALDPDYYSDLTYSLVSGPEGMNIQPKSGLISWTPSGYQAGKQAVTIKVTDYYGTYSTQSFDIAVEGMVPNNSSPLIVSDPQKEAYTTRPYTYQVKALDPNNDTLRYSLIKAPLGMTIKADTGLVSWEQPIFSSVPDDITVQVQDGKGGIDTQSFQLTVSSATPDGQIAGKVWEDLNDNQFQDAGERGLASVKVYLDANNNAQLDVGEKTVTTDETGSYLFSDLTDGYYTVRQVVPETFVQTSPFGAAYGGNILKNGSFEQGPANVGNGAVSVYAYSTPLAVNDWTIKGNSIDFVYDNFWQPSDAKVSIDLNGWGQGAITQVINTTPGQTYQVTFDLTMNFGNYWDKPMTLSAGGQSTNFTVTHVPGQTEGDMKWQRNKQWLFTASSPTTEIGFYSEIGGYYGPVIDNAVVRPYETGGLYHGLTLANSATVNNKNFGVKKQTVVPVNRQPNFVSTPSILATVGQTWRYLLKATDPDSDTLTYSLTTKPDGMTIDETTGLIAWKPTPEQLINSSSVTLSSGVWEVGVKANDGQGGINTQFFQVQVTFPDSNSSPVFIAESPKKAGTIGHPYQFTFKALDPEGDAVTYSSPNAVAFGASLNPNTGEISWTPTGVGKADFIVKATDTKGASTVKTFTIESVSNAANVAPTIVSLPSTLIAPVQVYQYQIVANDSNNDPLTYSLASAPSGMQLDNKGRIIWTPTAANLGKNAIQINVSDGRGGVANQTYELEVKNPTDFKLTSPKITSTPSKNAATGNQYRYTPTVSNPDNDFLVFTLDSSPAGMVIDPATGTIVWTPTADSGNTQEVALTVIGSRSGSNTQNYTLAINPTNTPPQILSNAVTNATVGRIYRYKVAAKDIDGDLLTYSLANYPAGMKIDAESGVIEWTPSTSSLYDISVKVEDSNGGIITQDYRLNAGTSIVDTPPQIISQPVTFSAVGQTYQYQVTGIDPTGTVPVRYYFNNGAPYYMTINSDTGLITWNPTAFDIGKRDITVAAYSSYGTAYQTFSLSTINNTAPVINSTPVNTVTAGATYRYNVVASDTDNDALTYNLLNPPQGMSIDKFGGITWNTSVSDIGNKIINVAVSDNRVQPVVQNYTLAVVADNEVPKVNLVASRSQIDKGDKVTFQVSASDNVRVSNLSLKVNNNPVVLDKDGFATVALAQLGNIIVDAFATDPSGNQGSNSKTVRVIDPTDLGAPNVKLDLSGIVEGVITAPTNIKGTVSDSNLDRYTLSVAPLEGGDFQVMFSGNQNVNNGVLGKFDSSVLQNGSYVVKLTAIDKNGLINEVEDTIHVTGDLKLGNFRLSFTDLSIPVSGIPISVTRTYDTLNVNSKDDFGYGWRLEFRDTDLRTSLRKDEVNQELGISTVPFKDGTRVFVTLPGGKREAFTFKPSRDRLSGFLQAAAPPDVDAGIYHPEFVGDKGVTSKLTVVDSRLSHVGNEYYDLGGTPYNPADSYFGGKYVLTTKEGIVYEIDGSSGDLLTATNPNGNKLTFTDAGIFSDSGKSISFGRDAGGRITSVTDLLGKQVKYQYDAKGDLVGVTDRENNTTTFEYFAPNRPHFLTEINDPLGRPKVRTEYDEKGRLKKQLDVNGKDMEFIYDPANSIQTVFDVFDKPTTYVYDERGNVVQEVNALGGITKRTFDENNNLLSQTNPENETFTYTYDSDGNLITVTNPLGNVTRYTFNRFGEVLTKTDSLGRTTTYTYDSRGNRRTLTDAEGNVSKYNLDLVGNVTEIMDADNKSTRFEYDQFGNITRQVDALNNETTYTYDANGNQLSESTTVTTPTGKKTLVTNWTYDTEGHVKSMTDPQGNVIRQEYDKLGNMTAVVEENMNNRRTEYRYNEEGQLEQTLYPDGTSARSVYDAAGREIAIIDQKGQTTHFVYDDLGRLVETIYPDNTPLDLSDNPRTKTEYDKIGRAKASIDERGNRTEYEYDKAGRQTLIRDALNNETKYTYNSAGNRLTQTDARNNTTKFVYDELGRQVETHFADGTRTITTYDAVGRRSSLKDQAGHTTYFVYDALNRPIEVIHPDDTSLDLSNNPRTKTEYNELGWVTAQIDELGNRQEYEYDEKGRLIESRSDCSCRRKTYTYDAFGNRISETDQLGHTTSFVYDKLNRLVETHFQDSSYTTTTYDELGRIKTQTDQAGKITKFEYDALGRLSAVVDALQQRTEYKYDKAGNLIQAKDANQHITQYEYDGLNRRTTTILPLGQRSDTTYDPVGNIASTIDFNRNTITYEYDKLNRMLAKRFPDTTAVEYTYTPTGQIKTTKDQRGITTYDYDVRERLISRIDPDNQFIRYGYDAASNRTEVITPTGTTKFTYDKYNQLETVTDPNFGLTRYTYDKAGNLIRTVLPNNTVETRQYNDLNRLVFLENTGTSGVISSYRYTLDPVGNRKVVEEHDGRKVEYNYDDLYRLTQEKITDPAYSNRTINYTYDAVGNRKSSNDSVDGLTNYIYDNNDRLLSDGSSSYTYDNNGNTLSRIKDATERVVYSWDYENRLVGANITKPSGNVQNQYKYNPDGIRVATIVNGQETRYLIDANQAYAQVLEEYTPGGAVQASYVYGKDLISQNRGGVRSFYHVDGLGSTRALTNASGVVTDTYDYGAYGNLLGSVSNTINNYRFAGEQFDPYLGDYYLRRRYYDSDSGRFTTTDPFEGVMTEPLSRAKYPYVHGNPVNAIDPSGLFSITENTATQLNISSLASQSVPTIKTATTLSTGTFPEAVTAASPGIANVARASISIGARVAVNVAKLVSRITILAGEAYIQGFPVIVWGQDLPQTTQHTQDAITGQGNTKYSGGIAPTFLFHTPNWPRSRPHPEFYNRYPGSSTNIYPRSWYNDEQQCFWDNSNPIETVRQSRGKVCDEYPYASTAQGGFLNYELNHVSLRLVSAEEQLKDIKNVNGVMVQNFDSQYWKLGEFYTEANIPTLDARMSWFGVGTTSDYWSYWVDRKGVKHNFF
ncbi:putative Ig domain-containing protein [Argonema antarcticum]|uniref:putative Ig domain-containing protein n=1 Tax=Argonema antarcticum TaxID=2942763 RepID=UPI0020117606